MWETPLEVRVSLYYRSKSLLLMWALVLNKWLRSCLPVVGHAHCFGAVTVADRQRTCSVFHIRKRALFLSSVKDNQSVDEEYLGFAHGFVRTEARSLGKLRRNITT